MINEKNGSIIGALIEERNDLLNRADANMCDMRNGSGVFRLDDAFGVGNPRNNDHKTMNDLQTKMSVFNVLFDVYKILSIELHRGDKTSFMACCPMCTDGYLMKEEYQAFVDSIRECLPMRNVLIDNEEDPIQMERMLPGSMTFMESQCGDRNFIQSFVTQADISGQSSDCDLLPPSLRSVNFCSRKKVSRRLTNTMKFAPQKKVCHVLNNLSNRCLAVRTRSLRQSFINPIDTSTTHDKVKRLEEHLSSDCKYNPFRLVSISDEDNLRFTLFFTSIRDKARYQALDRSGTYLNETEHFFAKLIYDYDDYEHRYRQRVGGMGHNRRVPLWREQFDHTSKVCHDIRGHMLDSLQSEM